MKKIVNTKDNTKKVVSAINNKNSKILVQTTTCTTTVITTVSVKTSTITGGSYTNMLPCTYTYLRNTIPVKTHKLSNKTMDMLRADIKDTVMTYY